MREREDNSHYHIIYPSETIIFDKNGKRVVACPTEDEAVGYIREAQQNRKEDSENEGCEKESSENKDET